MQKPRNARTFDENVFKHAWMVCKYEHNCLQMLRQAWLLDSSIPGLQEAIRQDLSTLDDFLREKRKLCTDVRLRLKQKIPFLTAPSLCCWGK